MKPLTGDGLIFLESIGAKVNLMHILMSHNTMSHNTKNQSQDSNTNNVGITLPIRSTNRSVH